MAAGPIEEIQIVCTTKLEVLTKFVRTSDLRTLHNLYLKDRHERRALGGSRLYYTLFVKVCMKFFTGSQYRTPCDTTHDRCIDDKMEQEYYIYVIDAATAKLGMFCGWRVAACRGPNAIPGRK